MQVYLGIDWSVEKHDVAFQDELGRHLLRLSVPHSLAGFLELDQARQQLGVGPQGVVVGMETAHNLMIDFLWQRGYGELYVLPPSKVESSRGRLRQSSAWDDRLDADLIAELVRTDRHRLYPWQPGSPLLQEMRARLRLVSFLTKEVVRYANRLHAVLRRYYPAALQVFSGLTTQIALAFIQAYPNPQAVEQLTYPQFCEFAQKQAYSRSEKLAKYYANLQEPQPPPTRATQAAYQQEALLLTKLLSQLLKTKGQTLRQLRKLYEQHPDRGIYDSLPKAGVLTESGLLVKFGEDRKRFPDPSLVQALAGTCPVTKQSGRRRRVVFRRACDREFRYIVQEWARLTIDASPWASDYYQQVRPRCGSDNDAYRRLANRWLAIVWKLWQDRLTYDETYHLRRRAARQLPKASAWENR